MRGRIAAVEWWVEKAETALSGIDPKALPRESVNSLRENFDRIDELLGGYLEEPPSLRPLLEYVRSLEAAALEQAEPASPLPESAPRAAPATSAMAATAPAGLPAGSEIVPGVGSKEDAAKVIDVLRKKALEDASYLRKEDLQNPVSYRLSRCAAWQKLENPPPATDGRTMIPSPDPRMLGSIDIMRSQGNHVEPHLQVGVAQLPQVASPPSAEAA